MFFSANELLKYSVRGTDQDIGSAKDFLFDDKLWTVRYLAVDTNKWLPASRKVVVSPIAFGKPGIDLRELPVALSREQVKNCPPLDEHKPVSRQYETAMFKYYGYSEYWMGPHLWGSFSQPAPLSDSEIEDVDDIQQNYSENLRSVLELMGYQIQAKDDTIGYVEDFIFDDRTWEISQIVVNTRSWLPGGRRVVIAPQDVKHISCNNSTVMVDLKAKQIKEGLEIDVDALHRPGHQTLLNNAQKSRFIAQ